MTPDPSRPADDLDADLRKELDERLGVSDQDDGALLARVKARVLQSIQEEIDARHRTVRAAHGHWRKMGPGIERKLLWTEAASESWMLRLAPGAVIRAHLHPTDEECVVLEGSLRIGTSLVLHKGDFHVAAGGSLHEAVTTDDGALIYIRGVPRTDLPR